ncbi:hypothetical protein [Anaeromyxobacter terrae]|uniref:hypothetical protein n=1 Tax=Anaeromyxobacter terrae TaxID=2925406 RepID=UPI001F58DA40|nr:hypothetical protein [Anaeromyxobacter sp. SG22]
MSAWRSSLLASVLAAALAACGTRDVETHPFAIQVTPELPPGFDSYVLAGTGRIVAPTVFVLAGVVLAEGAAPIDVEVRFRDDVPGGVVLPAQLDGAPATLVLLRSGGGIGPDGEPLPFLGLRLATGTGAAIVDQLILFEGAYKGGGTDILPITQIDPRPDLPLFRVREDWSEFEPAECGPVYYDFLEVIGDDELFSLRREGRRDLTIGAADSTPWKILHVLSWHRRGKCQAQAEAWTEFAAWR